jgi:hypothetical protein
MDTSIRKSKYDDNPMQSNTKSLPLTSATRDFLSTVSMLDDVAEQQALKILIRKNTALAKKTIWQYTIMSTARQYSDELKKILLNEDLNHLFLSNKKIDIAKSWQEHADATFSTVHSQIDAAIHLLIFWDDFEAVKKGFVPLSLTQKAQILAKELNRIGVSIPSLDATGRALRRLADMGFVLERKIEGKHTDRLYYVNPDLFVLWEKQKQVTTKPKTEAERFWFG